MPKMQPEVFSSPVIHRYNGGEPVLSKKDIPYAADCIFNAGVAKFGGKYVMVFRDDYERPPYRGRHRVQRRRQALGRSENAVYDAGDASGPRCAARL